MLLDVVVDLPGQRLVDAVLVGQLLEDLHVLGLLDVLRADVGDQRAHAVDVVREDDAANRLHEDHAQGFLVVDDHDVSEADGQHDGGAPVVGPDVLLEPGRIAESLAGHPVGTGIEVGHADQDDGQHVREAEVEQENLAQRPILLVVVVLDEEDLQLLQPFQTVLQLQQSNQTEVAEHSVGGRQIGHQNQYVREVDRELVLHVVRTDLLYRLQLSPQTESYCHKT